MGNDGKAFYDQGLACERAGDITGAFDAFRRSAKANPRIAAPFVGLSRCLIRNHQRSQAIQCLQKAVACEPSNPALYVLLGNALLRDSQLVDARSSFERALTLKPSFVDALAGLAKTLEDSGDKAGAANTYQALLQQAPGDPEGHAGLLNVADADLLDTAIDRAKQQMARAPVADRALIGYALGKVLARQGEHRAAFSYWRSANSARRQLAGEFNRAEFERRVASLISLFTPEFYDARRHWRPAEQSQQAVFVVGLPRSGTTLTEQILASHPDILGAGELDLLTDLATATPDHLNRPDLSWPETAPHLSETLTATLGEEHLTRLRALARGNRANAIVDKQPLNFWHLGLIALTLPQAKIIHCRRDLRDNGLSIFAENFIPEQRWATDLEDIAVYWRGYNRLMRHWQEATSLSMLDVDYEATIADITDQSERLAQHLDLAWHENMIHFHQHDRQIQTPSRWQVRQPLYRSSSGRWRHYENELQALCRALPESVG